MGPRIITAVGLAVFVTVVYVTTGAGRIDIIDGQYRFEVAKNIVEDGSIDIRDPFLGDAAPGILVGAYSPYGISGSLVGLPLVWLAGLWQGEPSVERQEFFFSFTSAALSGATAGLLFIFYVLLGVEPRRAVAWTLVAALATLTFPASTTVFDQAQHGFFVMTACLLAFLADRRRSVALAIAGGIALAVLVNFQETYAIFFPALAILMVRLNGTDPQARRASIERALVFMIVGGLGLLFWASLNNYRFGSLLYSGKGLNHPPVFGNPLIGASSLLFSPGKSIFLYSPPTLIAVAGLFQLAKRERRLVQVIAVATTAYLGLISTLTFFGGDWCWGPRYFVVVLPLIALGFPFFRVDTRVRRAFVTAIVSIGVCVQLLAISVEHHRYFYQRSLATFFWYAQPGYYFTHSALFARPGEILDSIRDGVPKEADEFRPGPYSARLTYAVFGGWGHPGLPARVWMRHYQVFWLPRPWPLWMVTIDPDQRPVNLRLTLIGLSVVSGCSAIAVCQGLRMERARA